MRSTTHRTTTLIKGKEAQLGKRKGWRRKMKFIADTHIHSIASNHAYSTIMENIEAARQKGLVYMAMTEHGPKMPDAPHIWHCVNQWEVPSVYNGVNILHGAEVDIMDEEGTLDIDDHILAGLEWVIASMHTPCIKPSTKENHTKAWLNIAKILM